MVIFVLPRMIGFYGHYHYILRIFLKYKWDDHRNGAQREIWGKGGNKTGIKRAFSFLFIYLFMYLFIFGLFIRSIYLY